MTTRANGEADIADPASMRPAFGTPDDGSLKMAALSCGNAAACERLPSKANQQWHYSRFKIRVGAVELVASAPRELTEHLGARNR